MSEAEARVLELLEVTGALRRGHFRLSSGLHSEAYVQCALLLEDPRNAAEVGWLLAVRLRPQGVDSVLSPALGGLVIGQAVAAALDVPFRFAERAAGKMALRRGFRLRPGERVAIVEDVVTTGGSAAETADLARSFGAEVAAFAAIIDRSGGRLVWDGPCEALVRLELATWDLADCPHCQAGDPLDTPGSRPASG